MFKCKECGTEYKEKPDYCDCGNDTFEEIVPTAASQPKPEVTPKQTQVNTPTPKPNPAPQIKTVQPVRREYNSTFNTSNSEVTRVKSSADMVSLGLFVTSIVLALCTIFFIGNPKEQANQPQQEQTSTQTTPANIPSVDSYWDNSTVGIVQDSIEIETPQEEQPPVAQAVQPVQKDQFTSKFDEWLNKPKRVVDDTPKYTQQPAQQTTKPVQTQTKTAQQAKTQTTKTKATTPVSSNNAKINSPGAPNDLLTRVQNNIQFTNTTTPKAATTSTTPKTTTSSTTQTQKQTTTTPRQTTTIKPTQTTTTTATQSPPTLRNATAQNVKSQAELKQELANYKNSLRNNIGKKINFANVLGDGNCSITFKVDSSGKLINRNFATKSSNVTLNDAVYNAMMSTPSYNPPPEGYKSETMTLKVRIYDGNYEISLN